MGKAYTRPVINACGYVDHFIDKEDFLNHSSEVFKKRPDAIIHVFPKSAIAAQAFRHHIKWRIGTTNRLYHWYTCNKLVKLSRRRSNLHEAQLNLRLLQPFGYKEDLLPDAIGNMFGLNKLQPLEARFAGLLHPGKFNLILHTKSQGSAREWGLGNFIELVRLLDENRYKIFISGTQSERSLMQPIFDEVGHRVTDITGTMNLDQFISFIHHADGLVAGSTGPLHIAAALGKTAFGIYPPIEPMHPGRWAPLGAKAKAFVVNKTCSDCRKNAHQCKCMYDVSPLVIAEALSVVNGQ